MSTPALVAISRLTVTAGVAQLAFGAFFILADERPTAVFSAGWAFAWSYLAGALIQLARSGVAGRVGPVVAAVGALAYVVAETVYLIAVPLVGLAPAAVEPLTDRLLPAGAVLAAVGMLVAGVVVLRRRRWSGWARFAPLAVGVYPFVAMFSAIAVTGAPSGGAIAGWGAAWVAFGLAARRAAPPVLA